MRSPVDFRSEAEQCLRLAEQARARRYKALLVDLAQAWALLEEQASDLRRGAAEALPGALPH